MKQCSVNLEFFNRSLTFIHSALCDLPNIVNDCITPSSTSVQIGKTNLVTEQTLVYISDYKWVGIVTAVDNANKNYTKLTFSQFESLFSCDFLFDVTYQNRNYGLSTFICDRINEHYVNNPDSLQNWPLYCHSTNIGETGWVTNWTFGYDPETENGKYVVKSLYTDLISKAMSKYGVGVNATFDFANKRIDIAVGKRHESIYIEADIDTVELTQFKINDAGSVSNKLIIYNNQNYSEKVTYYRHEDGSYNTSDSQRIEPVVQTIRTAAPTTGDNAKTFQQVAKETAANIFDGITLNNLIELDVNVDDVKIKPLEIKYGQTVKVIHEGYVYESVLTKKTYGNPMKLTFGSVRTSLTQKLKRSAK